VFLDRFSCCRRVGPPSALPFKIDTLRPFNEGVINCVFFLGKKSPKNNKGFEPTIGPLGNWGSKSKVFA
jgi:hypothetical protein